VSVVRVGEIELDVERRGAGPALLAIMGMSGTALHWGEPFLAALAADFDVIAYDHRGVGASTALAGPITIGELAADASALLAALELDSAHVLGISMGGMVAQELALAHPEQIRTLTLGCTYGGGETATRPDPAPLGALYEAIASGDRARALRASWEINVSAAEAADSDAYAAFLAIAARRSVATGVIMAQAQAVLAHDTAARLGALRIPTLVVHGSEDRVLPVENGRTLARLIPDAKLEILEGVGHMFFFEQPLRAAALIRAHALGGD
jgi:pimeloyl-ACP methyl ester carboxylesterase